MNSIYKNIFALPNLKPYTKHKKRIIPAIIIGRISFFLLYYTPNSLCWLERGPPYKNVVLKVGGVLRKVGDLDPPTTQWLRPCTSVKHSERVATTVVVEARRRIVSDISDELQVRVNDKHDMDNKNRQLSVVPCSRSCLSRRSIESSKSNVGCA